MLHNAVNASRFDYCTALPVAAFSIFPKVFKILKYQNIKIINIKYFKILKFAVRASRLNGCTALQSRSLFDICKSHAHAKCKWDPNYLKYFSKYQTLQASRCLESQDMVCHVFWNKKSCNSLKCSSRISPTTHKVHKYHRSNTFALVTIMITIIIEASPLLLASFLLISCASK